MQYYSSEAEAMALMSVVMITAFSIVFALMIAFFLFEAIGLYQISKKRGYQKPWLAFIPVGSGWVLGSISDNIDFCYGKQSRLRIWLVIVEGVWFVFYIAYFICMAVFMQSLMESAIYQDSSTIQGVLTLFPILSSFVSLISMGHLVVRYMAAYKLFQDYDKKNTVLYLVLSILLGIACFFIFACRNKSSASLYWSYCQKNPGYCPPNSNPPYGNAPYGSQPYTGAPNGSAPYGNPPYTGTPNNNVPYGNPPYTGVPSNNAPSGNPPYTGTPNSNTVPNGGAPNGWQPGATPSTNPGNPPTAPAQTGPSDSPNPQNPTDSTDQNGL